MITISTKIVLKHVHGWYTQKVANAFVAMCYIIFVFSELLGWKKLSKIWEALVIEPLCSFNKLTGSDESLYEHDRLEYHKSINIEVRW